jgi:hypothetical protein
MASLTGEEKLSWLSFCFSVLAIAITCIGLYYSQLRGAYFVTSTGNYVYVQGRPRIGIPVTFFNDGARAGVINSGSMTVSDGANIFQFDLKLVSSSGERWIEDEAKIKPVPAPLTFFSPIAIKGGDAAEGVFWYFPHLGDFKFRSGADYSAELTFSRNTANGDRGNLYGGLTSVELSRAKVIFHIDGLTANNALQNPEIAIPVPTGWPQQNQESR